MADQKYIVIREAKEAGAEILAEKPYSTHPDDWYLRVVLARVPGGRFGKQFVTWLQNLDCGGYAEGHYCDSFEEALQDFNDRHHNMPLTK